MAKKLFNIIHNAQSAAKPIGYIIGTEFILNTYFALYIHVDIYSTNFLPYMHIRNIIQGVSLMVEKVSIRVK